HPLPPPPPTSPPPPSTTLFRSLDPDTAVTLRPTDPQRILRALEIYAATGKSLLSFQHSRSAPLLDAKQCHGVFLTMDRTALRARDRKSTRLNSSHDQISYAVFC